MISLLSLQLPTLSMIKSSPLDKQGLTPTDAASDSIIERRSAATAKARAGGSGHCACFPLHFSTQIY